MLNNVKKGLPNKIGRPFFLSAIRTVFMLSVILSQWICPQAMASLSEVDASTRQQYNKAVEDLYNKFVELKSQYPELNDFSKNVMGQDENGFSTISYEYDLQGRYGYRFFLHAQGSAPEEVLDQENSWQLKFPLLKFNVAVESKHLGEQASIKAGKIINDAMQSLKILEQGYLPFRLELSTDKKVYNVKERITLTVSLKNTGPRAFKVADLNEQSLYCEIDNMVWGEKKSSLKLNMILDAYGSLAKTLRVQGISSGKDAWLACTYGLGFKGVQPYSRIKVTIQSAL